MNHGAAGAGGRPVTLAQMRAWPLLLVVGCAGHTTSPPSPAPPRAATVPTLCDAGPPDLRARARRAELVHQYLERAANRMEGRDPTPKASDTAFRRARGAACGQVSYASKLRRSDDATLGVAACHTQDVIDDGRSRIIPVAVSADGRSALLFVHLEAELGREMWWSEHVAHVNEDVVGLVISTGAGAGGATPTGDGITLGPTGDFDEDGVLDLLTSGLGADWHMMSLAPTHGRTVRGLPVRAARWNGISNPVLGVITEGRSTYLLAAEEGLVATCARPDNAIIHALHWASDTSSFVPADLGPYAIERLADLCRPVRVLRELDPVASPTPVGASLERRRAWVFELTELARRVDLPLGDFAAVLRAEAALEPCTVGPN